MEDDLRIGYAKELTWHTLLPYYNPSNKNKYINYKSVHKHLPWEEVITHVEIGLDHDYYTCINKIRNPHDNTVLVNKYNQLPKTYLPEDLELISVEYNSGMLLLRHEARIAFETMCRSAEKEGLHMEAISTYRSYNYQEEVYLRKLTEDMDWEEYRLDRDKVSARPGHSEHQTGLAVDVNDLEQTFKETEEGKWLALNSYQYGYILRYPENMEYITGYDYEPWHFRYVGLEWSKDIYCSGLTYDEYYIRYIMPLHKNVTV